MLKRTLLFPVYLIYRTIIALRNFCFDYNLLKIHKLPVPVISVGNITAGGTGKTPFTIALCDALKHDYKHILVLSRGYGRASKGAQLVSLKGEIKLDVKSAGDEPFLIAKRCRHITVVVAERRIAGWNLVKLEKPELVILDDGFQHRYIHRDIDIVLNNGLDPMENDSLIPYGRLREPLSSLKRASFICNTKNNTQNLKYQQYDCTDIVYKLESEAKNVDEFTLITAVANPNEVLAELKELGIKIVETKIFKDHDNFSKLNLDSISSEKIVCTEKDYDKLLLKFPDASISILRQKYILSLNFISDLELKISELNQVF